MPRHRIPTPRGFAHSLLLLFFGTLVYACAAAPQAGTVVSWGQQVIPLGYSHTRYIAVAAGLQHTLALKADGSVAAWGQDSYGATRVPPGLSNVVAISAGDYHSLALRQDGTVVAWGRNDFAQATVPSTLSYVTAIAGGASHSVALKADGTVVGWGGSAVTATPPQGLTGVVAIAAGSLDNLAVKCDGTVVGWGYNSFGLTNIPPDLTNVAAVAVGERFAAALRRDGTVTVWGVGFVAEYIDGWTDVIAISAGFDECYALGRGGSIFNSGSAYFDDNKLPDMESTTDRYLAITSRGRHNVALRRDGIVKDWNYPTPGLDNITGVSAGFQSMNAGVRSDGTVHFWGNPFYKAYFVTNLLSNVVSVAQFGYLNGALLQDGRVASWSEGEDRSFFFYPWESNVTAIASSDEALWAVKKDGTLGLVVGEPADSIPAGLSNGVAIATGISLRLALRSDGSVFAWGWYPFSPPGVPASATNITAVSAGGHALALRKDGTVIEWSLNGVEQTNVPPDLTNVVAISAGSTHSLALKSNGTVVAWGDNSFGQTNVPPGLTNVFAISAGNARSLALVRLPMPPKLSLLNPPPSEGNTLLQITSDPGAAIRIEVSSDLQTWSVLTNVLNTSGTNQIRESSASGSQHKFYRALLP